MSINDPIRLTRRDRAALALALHAVRDTREDVPHVSFSHAMEVLRAGTPHHAAWQLEELASGAAYQAGLHAMRQHRVKRARAALLIRALLRADAGDFGPWTFTPAAITYLGLTGEAMIAAGRFAGRAEWRRYKPLWESAPPMRAR